MCPRKGEKKDIDGGVKAIDDPKEPNVTPVSVDDGKTDGHTGQKGRKMKQPCRFAAEEEKG